MNHATLTALIETTLDIPVYSGKGAATFPSATIDAYRDTPAVFGDGKSAARTITTQVDLYYESEGDRDAAAALLLNTLEQEPGVTSPDLELWYDTSAKKFRAEFDFDYVKEANT